MNNSGPLTVARTGPDGACTLGTRAQIVDLLEARSARLIHLFEVESGFRERIGTANSANSSGSVRATIVVGLVMVGAAGLLALGFLAGSERPSAETVVSQGAALRRQTLLNLHPLPSRRAPQPKKSPC